MAPGSNCMSPAQIFMYQGIILSMFPVFISTVMSGWKAKQPWSQSVCCRRRPAEPDCGKSDDATNIYTLIFDFYAVDSHFNTTSTPNTERFFSCSQSVIVVKLRSHREGSCSLVITVTIITRRLQFLMLVFVVMSCGTDKNTTQPWGPLDLFSLGGQDTRREREFWYFLDICSFHQSKHAGSQGFLLLKWFDSIANCISCSMALMTFFLRLLTLKFHLFQKSF